MSTMNADDELRQYLNNSPDVAALNVPDTKPTKRRETAVVGPSEHDIQRALFDRCNGHEGNIDPRLKKIHPVENTKGSGRGPAGFEYAAGIPDIFLPVPIDPFHGAYIEMKRQGKKPTTAQLTKHKELRADGYAVEWFDNEHEAFDFLVQYLAGEYPPF